MQESVPSPHPEATDEENQKRIDAFELRYPTETSRKYWPRKKGV